MIKHRGRHCLPLCFPSPLAAWVSILLPPAGDLAHHLMAYARKIERKHKGYRQGVVRSVFSVCGRSIEAQSNRYGLVSLQAIWLEDSGLASGDFVLRAKFLSASRGALPTVLAQSRSRLSRSAAASVCCRRRLRVRAGDCVAAVGQPR